MNQDKDPDYEPTRIAGDAIISRDPNNPEWGSGNLEVEGTLQTDRISSVTPDATISIASKCVFENTVSEPRIYPFTSPTARVRNLDGTMTSFDLPSTLSIGRNMTTPGDVLSCNVVSDQVLTGRSMSIDVHSDTVNTRIVKFLPGNVSLSSSSTPQNGYGLVLPPQAPTVDDSMVMTNRAGTMTFRQVPLTQVGVGTTLIPAVKLHFFEATTAGGMVEIYLTTTGTVGGTRLFTSAVLYAGASAIVDTTESIESPLLSIKTVATDLSTITFNALVGTNRGNKSLQFAPNGIPVRVMVMGT